MPFKVIDVRRWEAAAILLAITATFVIGLAALTRQTQGAKREAEHATKLALEQKRQSDTIRKNRDEQIRRLHDVDVRACVSTHKVVVVVEDLLGRSIAQALSSKIPDLTPRQQRRLDEITATTVANLRRSDGALHKADCQGVPPLPKVVSPS